MKYKALLLSTPSKTINNFWTCSITSPVGSLMPPCDIVSIAAVLRQAGIEPKILDLRLFDNSLEILAATIREWKPDAVIINVTTTAAMEVFSVLETVKETVPRRIVFGFHAMALPDEMFERGATHVLLGDPELSAEAAVRGETGNIKGMCTAESSRREPGWIDQLDNLPYPALDLIDVKKYHSLIMGRKPFSILLANRGCIYSCPYCVIPFQFGKKVRTLSVPRITGEMERDIKDFNVHSFFFIDSAINLKPDWTAELCEEIIKRKLNIRWCSNMRIPPVTRDLLSLMKRSGCYRLFYGVEDLDLVKELNRKTTWEATREAFLLTRETGIETVAFIVLFPGIDKSEKSMARRLVNMAKDIKADALQCNIAIPYPGSPMYREYVEKYNMPKDWSLYDPAGDRYPYSSDIDLIKVRRMVYLGFFLRTPKYIWDVFSQTDFNSLISFANNSLHMLFQNKK